MSDERPINVLFLCTANSARSILAEAILNRLGRGRFRAFSAGSFPRGTVNPHAIALLRKLGYETDGLASKSWEVFGAGDAARMDFIFTVCDQAAGEVCPIWPGHPMTAHWGVPDPAAVAGSEAEVAAAFADTYRMLERRIGVFVNLPLAALDRMRTQQALNRIGQGAGSVAASVGETAGEVAAEAPTTRSAIAKPETA